MGRLNAAGETIVEVLMVVAILGSVLTTAFAATTRANNDGRASQERSEAAAYGQDQVERLKQLLGSNDSSVTATNFCIDNNNSVVPVTNLTAGGCADANYGRYSGYIAYDNTTQTYTENVLWERYGDGTKSNLQVLYRTEYIQDASGSGPVAAPPAADNCPATSIPTGAMLACYYNDISFGRFALSRIENPVGSSVPDANSANPLNDQFGLNSPGTGVDSDDFSARYQGKFNFQARNYTFTAGADDGFRVYIDGALVFDQFHQQGYTTYTGDHGFATAGLHTVELDFYENRGAAAASINWLDNGALPRTGLIWTHNGQADASQTATMTGRNYCWNVFETAEPAANSWDNNYLCSDVNLQLQWSEAGPLANKFCYSWAAAPDPQAWSDNYLCAAVPLGLDFSGTGPTPGERCIAMNEPADTHSGNFWNGSAYICESASMPDMATLEVETFNPPAGNSCIAPVSFGAASASKVLQYCSNYTATSNPIAVPDFQTIAVTAFATDDQGSWPTVDVKIDGNTVGTVTVNSSSLRTFYINVPPTGLGMHTFSAAFTNDSCSGCSSGNQTHGDRNVWVDKLDLYRDSVIGEFEGETMSNTNPIMGINPMDDSAAGASAGKTLLYYSGGVESKLVKTGRITDLNVRARGDQWLGAPHMTIKVDGTTVGGWAVSNTGYQKFAVSGLNIAPGDHSIAVSFDNDQCGDTATSTPCDLGHDRNLYVDKIEFTAPETP